jgi:glyoxylate utilization-related uncharacterized protein
MSDTQSFSYETRLNIFYKPLQIVEEKKLADECEFQWYNQTLCQVNGDEFFYVVEGQLWIDLEGRTVSLDPRQGLVVPKGVLHRTRATQRTVVLMVENAGIIPTGN